MESVTPSGCLQCRQSASAPRAIPPQLSSLSPPLSLGRHRGRSCRDGSGATEQPRRRPLGFRERRLHLRFPCRQRVDLQRHGAFPADQPFPDLLGHLRQRQGGRLGGQLRGPCLLHEYLSLGRHRGRSCRDGSGAPEQPRRRPLGFRQRRLHLRFPCRQRVDLQRHCAFPADQPLCFPCRQRVDLQRHRPFPADQSFPDLLGHLRQRQGGGSAVNSGPLACSTNTYPLAAPWPVLQDRVWCSRSTSATTSRFPPTAASPLLPCRQRVDLQRHRRFPSRPTLPRPARSPTAPAR